MITKKCSLDSVIYLKHFDTQLRNSKSYYCDLPSLSPQEHLPASIEPERMRRVKMRDKHDVKHTNPNRTLTGLLSVFLWTRLSVFVPFTSHSVCRTKFMFSRLVTRRGTVLFCGDSITVGTMSSSAAESNGS